MITAFEPFIRKMADAQAEAERTAADAAAVNACKDLKKFKPVPDSVRRKRAELDALNGKVAKARAELSAIEAEASQVAFAVRDEEYQLARTHHALRKAAVIWWRLDAAMKTLEDRWEHDRRDGSIIPYMSAALPHLFEGRRQLHEIRDLLADAPERPEEYQAIADRAPAAYDAALEVERTRADAAKVEREAARRKERLLNPAY